MEPSNICKLVCGVTGVVVVLLVATLKLGIISVGEDLTVLKNTAEMYQDNVDTLLPRIHEDLGITSYIKFTFFNVSNTVDVKAGIAKPIVTEVGPFVYREVHEQTNILTIQDEISYGSYINYEFDAAQSCESCSLDTVVTIINPAMVIFSTFILNAHETQWPDIDIPGLPHINFNEIMDLVLEIIGTTLDELVNCKEGDPDENGFCDDMWLTSTPDDIIFHGSHSGVITGLNAFLHDRNWGLPSLIYTAFILISAEHPDIIPPEAVPSLDQCVELVETLLDSLDIPPLIDLENGSFGLFKGTNATKSWWKINNGKYDMAHYNKVLEYNGMTRLPESWWENFGPTPSAHKSEVSGICHNIIGTDGMGFAPYVDKTSIIWLFYEKLCRSIWLVYQDEVSVEGIKAYMFSPDFSLFSMSNPVNFCYCPKVSNCAVPNVKDDTWDLSGCEMCMDGILSMQGCQGVPIILSNPHFLDGDSSLVEAIVGLNPDREKHLTFINLEPRTGTPLQAHKRMQINVPVSPSTYFTGLSQVQQTVFPIVWIDEGAGIQTDSLDKVKKMVLSMEDLVS